MRQMCLYVCICVYISVDSVGQLINGTMQRVRGLAERSDTHDALRGRRIYRYIYIYMYVYMYIYIYVYIYIMSDSDLLLRAAR